MGAAGTSGAATTMGAVGIGGGPTCGTRADGRSIVETTTGAANSGGSTRAGSGGKARTGGPAARTGTGGPTDTSGRSARWCGLLDSVCPEPPAGKGTAAGRLERKAKTTAKLKMASTTADQDPVSHGPRVARRGRPVPGRKSSTPKPESDRAPSPKRMYWCPYSDCGAWTPGRVGICVKCEGNGRDPKIGFARQEDNPWSEASLAKDPSKRRPD